MKEILGGSPSRIFVDSQGDAVVLRDVCGVYVYGGDDAWYVDINTTGNKIDTQTIAVQTFDNRSDAESYRDAVIERLLEIERYNQLHQL